MPNDAKLGLIAGVAVVLLIAVVFFRKDAAHAQPTQPTLGAPPSITAPDTSFVPRLPQTPAAEPAPGPSDLPALPPPPTLPDTPMPSTG